MRALGITVAIIALLGAAFFVGMAQLDRFQNAHPDVAVRAGSETYFIPANFVRTDGWRTDLLRLAGCWDARDAAVISGIAMFAGCDTARRVPLVLPTSIFGLDVAMGIHKPQINAVFWPNYVAPDDVTAELGDAWAGRGSWAGRRSILRADWQMWRLESAASPWVYLLADVPKTGDEAELGRLSAGRCYRPEKSSDAGMTCNFALHIGESAVLEFTLGADEMMSVVALREALQARAAEWRKGEAVAVSGSSGPSA
jgi:hypothetical protein